MRPVHFLPHHVRTSPSIHWKAGAFLFALCGLAIFALALIVTIAPTLASGPSSNRVLNYQLRLTDPNGIPINGTKNIKLVFYDAATAGTALHSDCGTTGTPVGRKVIFSNGIGTVLIGDTAASGTTNCSDASAPNSLPSSLFANASLYLGITVEADAEMTPRKRIVAQGYALNADLLDDLDTSAIGGVVAFVPVTDSSGNLTLTKNLTVDGTTLFIDSGTNRVGIGTTTPGGPLQVDNGGVQRLKLLDSGTLMVGEVGLIGPTYTVESTSFGPQDMTGSTAVVLADDQVSSAITIPFNFTFYDTVYTALNISSNGFVTFDPGSPHGCCSGQPIPQALAPNNLIAGYWVDLLPPSGGTISYKTFGSSPSQIFVVEFKNVPEYQPPSNTGSVNFQIWLREGSNYVEIHTTSSSTTGHTATQGVENATGTVATAVSGRTASTVTITNDAVLFKPSTAIVGPTDMGLGGLVVQGNTYMAGNVGIGDPNPSNFKLELGGHVGPGTDDTYDLGSPALRWRDLYLGPTSMHLVSTAGETATARDWKLGIDETNGATDGSFRVMEGASQYLTIGPTGKVGIRTNAPATMFEVHGGVVVKGDQIVDEAGNVIGDPGVGTRTPIAEGAALVSAAGQGICTNSLVFPSEVYKDGNGDCTAGNGGTDVLLLGVTSAYTLATTAVTSAWAFNDVDTDCNGDGTGGDGSCTASDGIYQIGQDLYIDADPALVYTSPRVGIGTANPGSTLDVVGRGDGDFGGYPSLVHLKTAGSNTWNLTMSNELGGGEANVMGFYMGDDIFPDSDSSGVMYISSYFDNGNALVDPLMAFYPTNGAVSVGQYYDYPAKFSVYSEPEVTDVGGTTTANASTTITGVGTKFVTRIGLGDRISLSSAPTVYATVTAIASDTSLTVDQALGNGTSQTINVRQGIMRLSTSDTNKFLMNDTGNVFIGDGIVAPQQRLVVKGQTRVGDGATTFNDFGSPYQFVVNADRTDTSGFAFGTASRLYENPGSASTATAFGLSSTVDLDGANAFGTAYGVSATAEKLGSGAATSMRAVNAFVYNNAGNVTDFYALRALGQTLAGTITNAYGLQYQYYAQGGTTTNSYGIRLESPVMGGAITNNYGIYIDPQTSGTNNFALLYNHGSSPFAVTGAGNVGVGTSAPGSKLTVVGGAIAVPPVLSLTGDLSSSPGQFQRHMEITNSGAAGNVVRLAFGDATSGTQLSQIQSVWDGAGGGHLMFRTAQSSTMSEQMRITNAGNVGIGLSNPGEKLTVAGNVVPSVDDTHDLGTNALRWRDLYLGPGSVHVGTTTGDEGVLTYNTSTNVLNIDATGSVDINGGSGSTGCTVDGSGNLACTGTITGPGSSTAFVNGGNSFGGAATLGTNDNFAFSVETNNATRMTIDTAGNVGIGTSTPTESVTLADGANVLMNGGGLITPYAGIGHFDNLLGCSNAADDGSCWVYDGTTTVTANNAVAPDGTTTADTLNAGSSASDDAYNFGSGSATTLWTGSIWMKVASGTASIGLRLDDFDNSETGTVATKTVTTSWQRFSVTQTFASSTADVLLYVVNGTSAVQVWGAQLEQASAPGVYIATGTSSPSGAASGRGMAFGSDQDSIVFADAGTSSKPMIKMSASSTVTNARMVLAPGGFTDTGLQYEGTGAQKLNFIGGGANAMTVDLQNKRVGVGLSTPTEKLTVADGGNALLNQGFFTTPFGGFGRYQNYLTFSEDLSNAAWTKESTIVIAGVDPGPDGVTATMRVTTAGASATDAVKQAASGAPATANTTWQGSVWMRTISGTQTVNLRISSGNTTGTASPKTVTTAWQRFTLTQGFGPGSTGTATFRIETGTNTGAELWGAQLELPTLASEVGQIRSYVKTTSTAVTTVGQGLLANSSGPHLFTAGNVGMGEPVPTFKLDINGTSGIRVTGPSMYGLMMKSSSSTSDFMGIRWRDTANANLWSMGNDFNGNGNHDFWLYDNVNSSTVLLADQAATSYLSFGTTHGGVEYDNTTQQMHLFTNGTIKAYVNSNGNVGIGDSSPASLLTVGSGDRFNVNSSGDVTSTFTTLNGSSTANGAGANSTTLILTSATNFDVGNYVQVASAACVANPCFAKITAIATNTLTISPALSWSNADVVTEVHVPEVGGVDLTQALANRYGRGYFIDGVVTGNGSTRFTDNLIDSTANTLSLNTTNNMPVNFGTGAITAGGTLAVTGAITSAGNTVMTSGGNSLGTNVAFGTNDNFHFALKTNNLTRFHIANAGSIGIGTTSPEAGTMLDIRKTASGTLGPILAIQNKVATAAGTAAALMFGVDASNVVDSSDLPNAEIRATNTGTSDRTNLTFSTWNGSGITEGLRIQFDGNVGIGTSSPSSRLHVGNDSSSVDEDIRVSTNRDAAIKLIADRDNTNEDDNAYITFTQDGRDGLGIINGQLGMVGNAGFDPRNVAYTGTLANAVFLGTDTAANDGAVTPLQFGTNGSVRMTIIPSGSVGIGNTAPNVPLSVGTASLFSPLTDVVVSAVRNGSGENAFFLANTDSSGEDAGIMIGTPTVGEDAAIYMDHSDARKLKFSLGATMGTDAGRTAAVRMTMDQSGNVGIGDTTPTEARFVASSSGNVAYFNSTDATGSVNAVVVNNTSGSFGLPVIELREENAEVGSVIGHNAAEFGLVNGVNLSSASGRDIGFRVNNTTEAARITTGGLMGIGTSSPSAKLTVNDASLGSGGGGFLVTVGDPITAANLDWGLGGGERAVVINGGPSGGCCNYGDLVLTNSNASPAAGNVLGAVAFAAKSPGTIDTFTGIKSSITSALEGSGGAAGGFGASLIFSTRVDNGAISERMRINNAGNVGVGTTSPLARLDIGGNVRATGKATAVLTGSIDPAASTTVTGVGTLFTTELVVGDRITVTGETRTVTAIASNTSLTVDTAFSNNANDTSPDVLYALATLRDSSNALKVAVNDLGNVGIGTAAPGTPLDVIGTIRTMSTTPAIRLRISDTVNGFSTLSFDDVAGVVQSSLTAIQSGSFNETGSLQMAYNGSGGGSKAHLSIRLTPSGPASSNVMVFDKTGRVVVGPYDPVLGASLTAKFSVQAEGSAGSTNALLAEASDGTDLFTVRDDGVLFVNRAGAESAIVMQSDGTSLSQIRGVVGGGVRMTDASSATEWMRITSAGNVGIGDASPASLLTVGSGDLFQVNSSGNVSTSGTLDVNGHSAFGATGTINANYITNSTETMTGASVIGHAVIVTSNPSSSPSSGFKDGIYTDLTTSGAGSTNFTGTISGIEANADLAHSGTTQNAYAVNGEVFHGGSGTVSTLAGVYGAASSSGGSVTDLAAMYANLYLGSLTATNAYGLRVYQSGTPTSLSNNYGIYVDPVAGGASAYAIYTTGGQNYFSHSSTTGSADQKSGQFLMNSTRSAGNSYGLQIQATESSSSNNANVFGIDITSTQAGTAGNTVRGISVTAGATGASNSVTLYGLKADDSASAASSTGDHYGLRADVTTGSGGTHYGVYSNVSGGSNAYAGVFMGGNVGIGTASPGTKLYTTASSATVASFDRTTDDGTIVSLRQDGTEEGSISVSGTTVSYNAFTGSHYGWTDKPVQRGELVSFTGENRRLHGREDSEIVYGIAVTSKRNDGAVLGAYLALKEPSQAPGDDNPHLVMAVGNGDIWVVDDGANIAPGDYLISSETPGHAVKDDGVAAVSHIFAKAAEPVDWSQETATIDGKRHKRISVTFEAFDSRNRQEGLFAGKVSDLTVDADLDFKEHGISNLAFLRGIDDKWSIDENGRLLATEIVADSVRVRQRDEKTTIDRGTMTSGTDFVQVHNPAITPDSRVFVTFRKSPGSAWWLDEVGEGFFVLKTGQPVVEDVPFDYWLIDVLDERTPPPAPAPAEPSPAPPDAPPEPLPDAPLAPDPTPSPAPEPPPQP